jgi:hypothetical protein
VKSGSAVMWIKLKSSMNRIILGLHLKLEKFKTRVTKLGVLYVLHAITTVQKFTQNVEFKRLIPIEKIRIADKNAC